MKKHSWILYFFIGIACFLIAGILSFNVIKLSPPRHISFHRETNVNLIQEWMTLRYISHTYKVPLSVFSEKLHLSSQNPDQTLKAIAKTQKSGSSTVIHHVQTIITEFQTTHPRRIQ